MIYIVSGYMRSGTSMMMAALQAGGMTVVDEPQRNHVLHVHSDDRYKINPDSVFEPRYFAEKDQPGWPRAHDGKAIKIVAPFLCHVAVHSYRVCFMRRDPEEIRQSYEAAFGHKRYDIESIVCEALTTLRNRRDVIDIQEIEMRDVIENGAMPGDWPIDVEAARTAIIPDAYRFRRERLVIGA